MKRSFKLIILFSILFILSSFFANADITTNLIHRWALTTDATDSVGSADWTTNNGVTFNANGALFESANSDYLQASFTSIIPNEDTAFSMCYKMNRNSLNYMPVFVETSDTKGNWLLWGSSSTVTHPEFHSPQGAIAGGSVNLGIGTEYSNCIVRSGTTTTIYVDATQILTGDISNLATYTGTFNLGKGSGATYYDGYIKEYCIWDEAIDATDRSDYQTGGCSVAPAPATSDPFLITANTTNDNKAIISFNATVDGTTYITTNGTINTALLHNATQFYNITVIAPSYLKIQFNEVNVSTNLLANLTPVRLDILTLSNYVTLSGINYTRSLTYEYNYTCESNGTTNFYRIINGIVNKTSALTCDNTTKTANDYFNYSIEGRYNISFNYNTTFGNSTIKQETYFISDLNNPVVSNISFTFGSDFVLPTANVSMLCTDSIYTNLNYTLNLNAGLIFSGNKTNNTIQTNTTTALINGINNLTGICADPFGNSTDSVAQNIELRTLYIINEQTNAGFNVQNLSSVKVYLDDNRTSYDFKTNNKQNITFISTSDVKLRFELIYTDGTIILRYVDIGLLDDDIRVCANVEGITHYEHILTSSSTRPVILKSVFADCLVAADYTRFAYQNSKVLKAYTYNNLYYLYTFANNDPTDTQTFLASVDGSIATYINLDSLEFNEQGYDIAQTGDALSFYKRNANEVEIYYFNLINNNNDALRIVITNTEDNSVYFNSTTFSDPNEAQIIFNIATLGLNETSILKATATRTIDGVDSDIVGYFNIDGATGFINSGMMFILSIIILLFGLSLTAASRTFGWFGLFILIFNIGVLSFAASAWYVTFMQAINIICMVYIFLVMSGKNTAQIG